MRAVALLALVGCVAPQPPGGQFVCGSDSDCPDGFACQSDAHCYDRDHTPACFIYGQLPGLSTGCAGREGCYWGSSEFGPVCQAPGFIGQYGTGCDLLEVNSLLEERCAPGHVCVPGDGVFTFANTCLRICELDGDCSEGDACRLSIYLSKNNRWWAGNELRLCYPVDG